MNEVGWSDGFHESAPLGLYRTNGDLGEQDEWGRTHVSQECVRVCVCHLLPIKTTLAGLIFAWINIRVD